jgi:hypothetical protein
MTVLKQYLFSLAVLAASSTIAQQTDPVDVPQSDAKGVVRVQMLARVGASSISTRSLYIYTCIKTPRQCAGYSDFVKRDNGRDLQAYLLAKMAFEDNSIFKTIWFTDSELTRKQAQFEIANASVWRRLKKEIQIQDVEARATIEEISVFDALLAKQESLEAWIQQLRTRFKVQMFNQNAT